MVCKAAGTKLEASLAGDIHLFVRLSVCMSHATHTAAGSGGTVSCRVSQSGRTDLVMINVPSYANTVHVRYEI